MSARRLETNLEAIQDAQDVQQHTKDALRNIQRKAIETQATGIITLAELRRQREQLYNIEDETDHVNVELKHGQKLQNRLDRWAGRWGGRQKRIAKKEAKKLLEAQRIKEERKVSLKAKDLASEETAKKTATKAPQKKKRTLARGRIVPHNGVKMTTTSANHPEVVTAHIDRTQYSEEEQNGLNRIEENDNEIELMLNETEQAVAGLKALGLQMQEETARQSNELDVVEEKIDKGTGKQAQLNVRVKGALRGKWRKRVEEEERRMERKDVVPTWRRMMTIRN